MTPNHIQDALSHQLDSQKLLEEPEKRTRILAQTTGAQASLEGVTPAAMCAIVAIINDAKHNLMAEANLDDGWVYDERSFVMGALHGIHNVILGVYTQQNVEDRRSEID